ALLILLVANAITFLTALSLSAISTNTAVGGGGAYFLISRSLGLEFGGSVGVPLFLAQAISVAFYLIGFTESIRFLAPGVDVRIVCSAALAVFFVIAWLGAGLIIKTQYFIFGALILSLISFFTGYTPIATDAIAWGAQYAQYEGAHSFWTVFAIFFPAVTGIMSGVSMSGDLKDPSRSIPRGTILAVCITFVIYTCEIFWLALNAERADLVENRLILARIARVPALIYAGLWAATLSSALASLAAAPRTLQALARDGVVPRILGLGHGPAKEPRVALVLSALIAEACILAGELDLIAPVITMFFLATYGTVNLVAGVERLVWNPSYRPTFRVHWLPSFLGFLGCAFVMFLIHAPATLVAVAIIGGIYALLTRVRLRAAWGDMRSGFWFAITRFGFLRFDASRQHIRNWRPVILVLAGSPKAHPEIVDLARRLEARRGLLFLASIVSGEWEKLLPRQAALQESLETFIRTNRLSAVAKSVIAEDFEQGVTTLLQVAGIGQFLPNTVLVGWSDDAVKRAVFARAVRRILQLRRNLLVFEEAREGASLDPRIDVWWYAKDNGSLMVTLAYLLRSSHRFRDHVIRVLRIIPEAAGADQIRDALRETLADLRIPGEVEVIVSDRPPLEVIAQTSRRSEVCFAGLAVKSIVEQENPLAPYADLVAALDGNVVLTKSWNDLRY
ncbi:MAG: hypothetical protein JXP34_04110, partial [Planctomycetes bacterium]|nr:hypothetical protein [Planctomycetota bacterium]